MEESKIKASENKLYHLKVIIDRDAIIVGFSKKDDFCIVGHIKRDGLCVILSRSDYVENYELWRDKGMLVDSTPVKRRDAEYVINKEYCLRRTDIMYGCIYDFNECLAVDCCEDKNIKRFKHNKRPMIF